MDLFDKCFNFTDAEEARKLGWYPYFRPIQSEQGSEVIIDGKKVIMIGSNPGK